MQTIDYLLEIMNNDDELPHIDVDDVYSFMQYLIGNEMPADQIEEEIGIYELELHRMAFEGQKTNLYLARLLQVTAVPVQEYVVGL